MSPISARSLIGVFCQTTHAWASNLSPRRRTPILSSASTPRRRSSQSSKSERGKHALGHGGYSAAALTTRPKACNSGSLKWRLSDEGGQRSRIQRINLRALSSLAPVQNMGMQSQAVMSVRLWSVGNKVHADQLGNRRATSVVPERLAIHRRKARFPQQRDIQIGEVRSCAQSRAKVMHHQRKLPANIGTLWRKRTEQQWCASESAETS